MSGPLLLALLLAAGAAVAWARSHRRRRLRERETAARFEAFAERLGVGLERLDRGWRATSGTDGASFQVPERAILDAARRSERDGEPDAEERWRVQLAWRRAPLAPLATAFHLKAHGPRVLPRLCHPELRNLLPRDPRPVWRPSPLAPLGTLFVLDGGAGRGRMVTEEALREAGVDGRDLEGIALAVLRQRLDEEALTRALGGELVEIRPAHGCGAAGVLAAGDFLPAGARLLAAVPAPDTLLLAPPGERDRLAAELDGRQPDEPLSGRLLEIAPSGPRWAEVP